MALPQPACACSRWWQMAGLEPCIKKKQQRARARLACALPRARGGYISSCVSARLARACGDAGSSGCTCAKVCPRFRCSTTLFASVSRIPNSTACDSSCCATTWVWLGQSVRQLRRRSSRRPRATLHARPRMGARQHDGSRHLAGAGTVGRQQAGVAAYGEVRQLPGTVVRRGALLAAHRRCRQRPGHKPSDQEYGFGGFRGVQREWRSTCPAPRGVAPPAG